jgi:multidrug efflux pump
LRELPDIDTAGGSRSAPPYTGASAAVMENPRDQGARGCRLRHRGRRHDPVDQPERHQQHQHRVHPQRDIESAANDIRDAVSRNLNKLPVDADPPQIRKVSSDSDVIVWFNLSGPAWTRWR